jgi:F-type H+-transporting ATPase subunit c
MSRRFAIVALALVVLTVAAPAMAQEAGHEGGKSFWQFIGAAFAIGFAAAFGALGQGKGLAAACDAIGRNPGAGGPIRITMIIGLALIESLVIYALIIAFLLVV